MCMNTCSGKILVLDRLAWEAEIEWAPSFERQKDQHSAGQCSISPAALALAGTYCSSSFEGLALLQLQADVRNAGLTLRPNNKYISF